MSTLQEKINSIVNDNKLTISIKFFKLIEEVNLTQQDAANLLGITYCDARTIRAAQRNRTNHSSHQKFAFGVEIECLAPISKDLMAARIATQVACNSQSYNHTDTTYYKIVNDGSLTTRGTGCSFSFEVVTPVLQNFTTLKKVCKILNEQGATVNQSCGLHVHIDARQMKIEQVKNIYINYSYLEQVIDSFLPVSRRANNNPYCKSIRLNSSIIPQFVRFQTFEQIACFFGSRYYKVNPESYKRHKTIEFRQHSGTTNAKKIEMWVNFLTKLCKWSKNNRLSNNVNSIDEIPFLNNTEKSYFKERQNELTR